MNLRIKFFLTVLLLNSTAAYSQISPEGFQIGDKLTDEVSELPLQVVNHPDGKDTITLGDYRGKVIVLDFWGTWCKPCLVSIPHLFELRRKFSEDMVSLMVSKEKSEVISKFFASTRSPHLSSIKDQLFSVSEGKRLAEFFPYQTVPHTVIIDKNQVVRAITLPEYLTDSLMQEVITSPAEFSMAVKVEGAITHPMLETVYEGTRDPLYYSALLGFTPGFDGYTALERDTVKEVVRFYAKSQPILQFYLACANPRDFNFGAQTNRRILLVKDPTLYYDHYDKTGKRTIFDPEWKKKNCYNYEAIFPISFTNEMIQQRMKNDIDTFFGIEGSIEKRTVACLVLKRIPGRKISLVKENEVASGKPISVYRGKRMGNFVLMLNQYYRGRPFPPVFDETGYVGPVTLEVPYNLRDIPELQKTLRKQGLDLVWENRELGMFVLREKGYEPETNELVLTQFGYIPKNLVPQLPSAPFHIPETVTSISPVD